LSPLDRTLYTRGTSRGRAVAARRAHNPEVVGSNPTPATTFLTCFGRSFSRRAWRRSSVAEQGTHKPLVAGSNPAAATSFFGLQRPNVKNRRGTVLRRFLLLRPFLQPLASVRDETLPAVVIRPPRFLACRRQKPVSGVQRRTAVNPAAKNHKALGRRFKSRRRHQKTGLYKPKSKCFGRNKDSARLWFTAISREMRAYFVRCRCRGTELLPQLCFIQPRKERSSPASLVRGS
jgi:hypothetical protein